MIGDNDDDGGGSKDSDDVYKRSVEPVLVLLSDVYSDDKISVSGSRPSSYPIYTVTNYSSTGYCPKEKYAILI